mmetsp:Transcript_26566/g.55777  ORF Transcript_26566/g.55777 Transcript_26566/m.55777 type:complete len:210 (+) Transcript_26566:97-726(+)
MMMQSDHNYSSYLPPADEKVMGDLATLEDKISLCQSMLNESGASIDTNEALLAVIGFLEACVPRMVELIDVAAQGALQEGTFEKCLLVNDRLTNTLADVDKDPKDRQTLTPAAAATPSSPGGVDLLEDGGKDDTINGNMDNLKIDSNEDSKKTSVDPFAGAPSLMDPSPPENPFSANSTQSGPAVADAKIENDEDDDFDSFFRERTSAP